MSSRRRAATSALTFSAAPSADRGRHVLLLVAVTAFAALVAGCSAPAPPVELPDKHAAGPLAEALEGVDPAELRPSGPPRSVWEDLDDAVGLAAYPIDVRGRLGRPDLPEVDGLDLRRLQDDRATHEELWELFLDVAPEPWESRVTAFVIATDGPDDDLAAVARIDDAGERWSLLVDPADADDVEELEWTLVHELAHLISLGPDQVTTTRFGFPRFDTARQRCDGQGITDGCLLDGAYLATWLEEFWDDELLTIVSDIAEMDDPDAAADAVWELFLADEDRFVTDYAATDPVEDLAESFAAWVLWEDATGTAQWERKMRFFDAYPELGDVRAEIWQQLGY